MAVVAHLVPDAISDEALPMLREILAGWMTSNHPRCLRVFGMEETTDGRWTILSAPEPPLSFAATVAAASEVLVADRVPWAVARLLEIAGAVASLPDTHGEIDRRTVGFELDGHATLLPPFPRITQRIAYTGQSFFPRTSIASMSPEAIRGERRTPASDVYQLGYLGWKLLGAPHPFDERNEIDTLQALMKGEPIGRLRDAIDVPAALDEAITRALAFEPADRFADAVELARALELTAESSDMRARIVARVETKRRDGVGALLQGPVVRPCPKRWDELAPTDRDEVRHCAECALPVQRVRSVRELVPLNGSCVSYDPELTE